jgi:hypothetical protein
MYIILFYLMSLYQLRNQGQDHFYLVEIDFFALFVRSSVGSMKRWCF